jgi:hypothetical protein
MSESESDSGLFVCMRVCLCSRSLSSARSYSTDCTCVLCTTHASCCDACTCGTQWAARDLLPNRRIDYIMTPTPLAGGKGHVTKVGLFGKGDVVGTPPSAHYGVVADIRY